MKPIFLGADDKGYSAIYVYDKGVYRFNAEKKMFMPVSLFKFPKVWNLFYIRSFPDAHRIFFSGLYGLSIFNFKTGNINYRGHNPDNDIFINQLLKDTSFTDFYAVDGNKMWYGTWPLAAGGPLINYVDAGTNERKQYRITDELGLGYIEVIGGMKQQNGQLWFYGNHFIAGLTAKGTHRFFNLKNENSDEQSINFQVAKFMFEDKQNNVWIATDNGVFLFSPGAQPFKNYMLAKPDEQGAEGPTISACELKDGRIFIGTWGNGLYCYDKNFNPVMLPPELKGYYAPYSFWCIHQHSVTGQVWMGMQGGEMVVYDPTKHTAEKFGDTAFLHSTIRQVTEDHDGNLWFAMQRGHIVKWDFKAAHGDYHKGFSLVRPPDYAYPWKLFTDKNGFVWMASVSHGLFKFDPGSGKQIDHFEKNGPADKSLWTDGPFDIFQYNDTILLIADGAIDVLNTKTNKISHISAQNGLPSNTVNSLQRDPKGTMWLGMANGLCRMNLEKQIFSRYDRRDGLRFDNFNPAAVFKMKDGRLIYPTDKNFVVFDPARLQDALTPQDVVITDFRLANRSLLVDSIISEGKVETKYNNSSILVQFSTLMYSRQTKIHYLYMLRGLDKQWQHANENNEAIYNYLPPGEYTFMVKAENSDGISSRNITTLKITVTPPFWKTWWFLGLLSLLAITVLYTIDRERIKRLADLQKVRTQIAGNLRDDVNSTLSNINLLSEMAKLKADKNIERSKEYIDQISTKSRRMIDAMDDMLWSLNPDNDYMEKTILRMRESAEGLQHTYGTEIQIEIDEKVKSVKMDMRTRHELFLIFKEGLRTIASNSRSGTLVNADLSGGKLLVKIHNAGMNANGDPEVERSYQELRQRAKVIRAELDIQIDKKGIFIVLLVPLK